MKAAFITGNCAAANNRFIIQTDEPGVEVSWQVIGIRQDAWVNAHRIPSKKTKPIRRTASFFILSSSDIHKRTPLRSHSNL